MSNQNFNNDFNQQAGAAGIPHAVNVGKTLNTYFTVFWICLVAGFALMIPYVLIMFGVERAANADGTTFTALSAEHQGAIMGRVMPLLLLFYFGLISLIVATVFCCMLHYQLWKLIPKQIARTTPGKAVGFLFIPLFNFYWLFVSYLGLSKDMNASLRQRGIQCRVNEGLGLCVCILSILSQCCFDPSAGINLIDLLAMLISLACMIVAILFYASVKNGAIALLGQGGE